MKKGIMTAVIWSVTAVLSACSIDPFTGRQPYFIADGLVAAVHRDTCFYLGISPSLTRVMEQNDSEQEAFDLQAATGGIVSGTELGQYLEKYAKVDRWTQPQMPTEEDINTCLYKAKNLPAGSMDARRWAYQALRAAHINGKYEDAIGIYERYFSDGKMDIIRFRAMGRYAQALIKTGRKTEGLNVYLLLYDSYIPYRRMVAASIPRDEAAAFYGSTAGNHRKATLALIMDNLDKLVGYEPDSPRTLAAAVRLAMMVEQEFALKSWPRLSYSDKKAKAAKKAAMHKYDHDVTAYFIDRLEGTSQGKKPLWLAIRGHMKTLGECDTTGAEELFRESERAGADGMLKDQLHLFRSINEMVKRPEVMDAQLQKMVLVDLQWLDTLKDNPYNGRLRENYLLLLGNRFFAAGDLVRASACFNGTEAAYFGKFLVDIYADAGALNGMDDFISGRSGQPLDEYLRGMAGFTKGDMKCLQAMKYLRDKDFKKAYELSVGAKGFDNWYENIVTTDGAALPRPRQKMTRREMLKLVYDLSVPVKDQEKQAEREYALASVYYFNPYLSYSGNIWNEAMYQGLRQVGHRGWMTDYLIPPDKAKKAVEIFYTTGYDNRGYAEQLLKRAISRTKKPELKAKCAMMFLLKKVRKADSSGLYRDLYLDREWFNRTGASDYGRDLAEKAGSEEVVLLKEYTQDYGNTAFYRSYVNSCAVIGKLMETDSQPQKNGR